MSKRQTVSLDRVVLSKNELIDTPKRPSSSDDEGICGQLNTSLHPLIYILGNANGLH